MTKNLYKIISFSDFPLDYSLKCRITFDVSFVEIMTISIEWDDKYNKDSNDINKKTTEIKLPDKLFKEIIKENEIINEREMEKEKSGRFI